ncbi:MAG: phosphotransferase [Kofleriaceae bacterium]
MRLEHCLPENLRGPSATITPIAAGMSGAGVYRIDAGDQAWVLKISRADEPLDTWQNRLQIRQRAAEAGVTPRVVHADEARRAIVTAFVADRSFPEFYGDPRTREAAVAQLGRMIRSVHGIAAPERTEASDPRSVLATTWSQLTDGFEIPAFVREVFERVNAEPPPPPQRPSVLSHNDVNPSNVVYDGERMQLIDWDVAGRNDPFYDLAAIAVFLRMDDETSRRLLSAYEGETVSRIPPRFSYNRRLIATLCGTMFLHLARAAGHAGSTTEALESATALGEIHQRMRTGTITLASAEGRWELGLALIKEAASS